VAQALRHDLGVDVSGQTQRRVGVTQVVEANARQAGLPYQTFEYAADNVRVKAAAVSLAED